MRALTAHAFVRRRATFDDRRRRLPLRQKQGQRTARSCSMERVHIPAAARDLPEILESAGQKMCAGATSAPSLGDDSTRTASSGVGSLSAARTQMRLFGSPRASGAALKVVGSPPAASWATPRRSVPSRDRCRGNPQSIRCDRLHALGRPRNATRSRRHVRARWAAAEGRNPPVRVWETRRGVSYDLGLT
jgi:hypothetical protein